MFDIKAFRHSLLNAREHWHVEYVESIDSTNSELNRRFSSEKNISCHVLVAREQTGGHGRLNRHWKSVPGKDITASVLFPSPISPPDSPKLSLCASLALVNTLRDNLGIKTMVRWPNDVLTENGKLAGILCNYLSSSHAVICGIGINVNSQIDELDIGSFGNRTTIFHEIGEEIPLATVLSSWILAYEDSWNLASANNHIELAEQFNSISFYQGKRVRILPGAGNYREDDTELTPTGDEFDGVASGLSESGNLLILTAPEVYYEVASDDVIIPI